MNFWQGWHETERTKWNKNKRFCTFFSYVIHHGWHFTLPCAMIILAGKDALYTRGFDLTVKRSCKIAEHEAPFAGDESRKTLFA